MSSPPAAPAPGAKLLELARFAGFVLQGWVVGFLLALVYARRCAKQLPALHPQDYLARLQSGQEVEAVYSDDEDDEGQDAGGEGEEGQEEGTRAPKRPVVVCVGDSITHGRVSHDYVAQLSRAPSVRNAGFRRFVNAGVNSEVCRQTCYFTCHL